MGQRQKNGRHTAVGFGGRPGVLSSFFNFFPLATCHPISSLRPGGQCVVTARCATHLGTVRRCLAADESLCDTSHKASRDPSTQVLTPVVWHPRCNAFFIARPLWFGVREFHGGSQVSQTGRMRRGIWLTCVSRANGVSEAGRHACCLQVGTEIPRRSPLIRQCCRPRASCLTGLTVFVD